MSVWRGARSRHASARRAALGSMYELPLIGGRTSARISTIRASCGRNEGAGEPKRRGTWTSAKLGDDIPSARRFAERPSGIRIHAGARRWALMDEAARATCVDFSDGMRGRALALKKR